MNNKWNSLNTIKDIQDVFTHELRSYAEHLTGLDSSKIVKMNHLELLEYCLELLKIERKDIIILTILGNEKSSKQKAIHTQRISVLNRLSSILIELCDDLYTLHVRASIVLLTNIMRDLNTIDQ